MLAAVKCKQNVDPALADALDGAVADMSKMYMRLGMDLFGLLFGMDSISWFYDAFLGCL